MEHVPDNYETARAAAEKGIAAIPVLPGTKIPAVKWKRYQTELPQGFEKAKQMMAPVIQNDVRHDIGGDEQIISEISTEYSNVMFRHLLLPVWIGAYQFGGKTYQVMVNASTGEVQGERPYSTVKIALLVAAVLLVLMVVLYLKGSSS